MNNAGVMSMLAKIGFNRQEEDVGPEDERLPFFILPGNKSKPEVKAIVGPTFTTMWTLEKPNLIDTIDSARNTDTEDIRSLVKVLRNS